MKYPTISEMAKDVAEKALDEYIYEGKTIRQWAKVLKDYDDKQTTLEKIVERLEEKSFMVATSKKHYEEPQNGEWVEQVVKYEDAIEIIKEGLMLCE